MPSRADGLQRVNFSNRWYSTRNHLEEHFTPQISHCKYKRDRNVNSGMKCEVHAFVQLQNQSFLVTWISQPSATYVLCGKKNLGKWAHRWHLNTQTSRRSEGMENASALVRQLCGRQVMMTRRSEKGIAPRSNLTNLAVSHKRHTQTAGERHQASHEDVWARGGLLTKAGQSFFF